MEKETSKIIIFGATSAIAEETAKLFAAQKARLFLVGRDNVKLKTVAQNLEVLGASSCTIVQKDFSATDWNEYLSSLWHEHGGFDVCLLAQGSLGDQKQCEQDFKATQKEIEINLLSIVSILTPLANLMEQQGAGTIAVISSVAGDRGRKANYVYASAKAAVSVFLQGLRNRLSSRGVHVLTIKPGFVDTPMTKHMKKGPLFAQPERVARDIQESIECKRDVLYTPWFWYFIMLIIRSIPEKIFKHLSI